MDFFKTFLLLLVVCTLPLQASAKGKNKQKRLYQFLTKNSFQLGVGYDFWQQEVALSQSGALGKMNAAYKGIEIKANFVKPSRSNVRLIYGLNSKISFGQAKGFAQGDVSETFRNQNYTDFQLAPTFLYRANMRTEIGLLVPVGYRVTYWHAANQDDVLVEDANLFYYGYGLTLITRYNLRSAFVVSLVHQQNVSSSRWSIAWQYDLK